MLGLIYEDEGNSASACDCYFICADLMKKDSNKWFQVYELSEKLKLHKRQLYCLARLIRLLPDNADILEKRSRLLLEDEQYSRALSDLLACTKISNGHSRHISELYTLAKKTHRERDLLEYLESRHSSLLSLLSRRAIVF